MDLFEKGLLTIIVVALVAMFVAFFPDMRRYLKIRSM
jgi:hypothetical protein